MAGRWSSPPRVAVRYSVHDVLESVGEGDKEAAGARSLLAEQGDRVGAEALALEFRSV